MNRQITSSQNRRLQTRRLQASPAGRLPSRLPSRLPNCRLLSGRHLCGLAMGVAVAVFSLTPAQAQLGGIGGGLGGGVQIGGGLGGGARIGSGARIGGGLGGARIGGAQIGSGARVGGARVGGGQIGSGARIGGARVGGAQIGSGARIGGARVGGGARIGGVGPQVGVAPAVRGRLGISNASPNLAPAAASARLNLAPQPLQLDSRLLSGAAGLGLQVGATAGRLVVSTVSPGSLANRLGFAPRDQILAVNRSWVSTPRDLTSKLSAALSQSGRAWVYVNRNGSRQWINFDAAAATPRLGVQMAAENAVVKLTGVAASSVAARAGLRAGDEVLAVNGAAIATTNELAAAVRAAGAADGALNLLVRRDGVEQTVRARLRTDLGSALQTGAGARANVQAGVAARPRLGVNMAADGTAVRLTGVAANSVAARAGLRAGDEVLAVNGATIATTNELAAAVRAAGAADGALLLRVRRNGAEQVVRAQLRAAAQDAAANTAITPD